MKQFINKKLSVMAVCLVASSVLLSACVATPMDANTTATTINTSVGIGKTVFQSAVNQKCRQEMANSTLWKMSKKQFKM